MLPWERLGKTEVAFGFSCSCHGETTDVLENGCFGPYSIGLVDGNLRGMRGWATQERGEGTCTGALILSGCLFLSFSLAGCSQKPLVFLLFLLLTCRNMEWTDLDKILASYDSTYT